jgi:hypothetical protein
MLIPVHVPKCYLATTEFDDNGIRISAFWARIGIVLKVRPEFYRNKKHLQSNQSSLKNY